MAFVKKLQSGGTTPTQNIDYSQLEKALYDDLYSMSSKEARRAKPMYDQVASLIRSGALDKAVKFNPDRTYSIDVNQLPEELKNLDWSGHDTPLEKDLLGFGSVVRGEDTNKEALSSAMAAVRNYKESNTPIVSASSTGVKYKKNLQDLGRFVVDTHFKGNEENWATKFGSITDDEARKSMVLGWANENIDKYLENAQKEGTQFDYEDLKAAQDFKTLLKDPTADWNKISDKAYELGWNLNNFLMRSEEKEALKEKQTQEQVADLSNKYGLSQELANALSVKGFTTLKSERPIYKGSERQTWFDNYLKEKGAMIFFNPNTKKEVIVTKDNFLQADDFDQFHPGFGTTWTQDFDSGITFGSKKGVLKDYGNVGKELIVEGIDPNFKVYGWADEGTGDYLKKLQIILPSGAKQELNRQSNGIYLNSSTGETVDLRNKIKGFGGSHIEVTDYKSILKDENNPLSAILSKSYFNNLSEAIAALDKEKQLMDTEGGDEDILNKIAAHLRLVIKTGNPDSREIALRKYSELRDLFTSKNIPVLENYRHAGFQYKDGGVIMAQKGTAFKEYMSKYNVKPSDSKESLNTPISNKPFVSRKGTLGNMTGWEVTSLIGTGLSLIPGVGVAGGLITTGADIANDIQKDGFQAGDIFNWNTAANIGFTALAFFGAGAVGAAFKGATKGAKVADKAFEIGKVVQKANKLGATPGVKASLEAVEKLALNNSDDIAKALTKLNKAEDSAEIVAKLGVKTADEAKALLSSADKAIKYVNDSGVKHALGIPQIKELIKISPEILQKTSKYSMGAIRGATLAGGVSGGVDIYKDIKEKGISGVHVDDVKKVAFGINAGRQWVNNKETLRALERQATQGGTSAKTTFKIGDKDAEIGKVLEASKDKKPILGVIGKKKASEANLAKLAQYKKDIAAAYAAEGKGKLTDDEINAISDIRRISATKSGEWSIGDGPKMNKSIWRDARDYKLAKKAIEKYQGKSISSVAEEVKTAEKEVSKKTRIDQKKAKKLATLMKGKKERKIELNKAWQDYQDNVVEHKDGGILKYAEPSQGISYNSNPANPEYEHKARKGYLPYTSINKINNWQVEGGKYTNEYLDFINSIDDNWVNANKGDMNKYIQSRGSDILVKDVSQVKGFATDKKYGPYHEYMVNAFERQRIQPLAAPKIGVKVDPINIKPLNIPTDTKGGTTYKPKDKPFKWPVLDDIGIKNKILYLSTLDANRRKVAKEVEAANQVPLRSLMPNRQLTEYNPFRQMATETMASANRLGRLGYEGTANTSLGLAGRAEMWSKGQKAASELLTKGAATTIEHRQQQNDADYNTLAGNLQIADQNTANIKAGRAKGLVAESQLPVAANAALNNLFLADQYNAETKKKNQYLSGMYAINQDPAYRKLREEYAALAGEDNPYFKNWKSAMDSGATPVDWDKSQDYINWQSALKAKQGAMKPFMEQLESIKAAMAYNQPYQASTTFGRNIVSNKSGGTLKKKREQEAERKLFYKVIKSNNDSINKNSVDLSKDSNNPKKRFYNTIIRNNKTLSKSSKNKK